MYKRIVSFRRKGPLVVAAMSVALAVIGAGACGGDEEKGSTPPPLSTGSPPPRATSDSGSGSTSSGGPPRDASVLEASETAKTYAGSLAASESVAFGGGGYCNYKMTLKDISVEMVVLDTGDVADAVVRDLAVEEAVSCPYAPMEPSIQDFALKSSTTTTSGVRVELNGAKSNRPETSLVVDLLAQGSGYQATMTWKRTDQGPPLSWTVTAKIPLARK